MTRAAIYARVSHREQETLEDQERRCRAFAKAKDWKVARGKVFSDHGISAWSVADRPGWMALRRAVEASEVNAVVVFQVSRSARNVGALHEFLTRCRDRGVTFASVSEGLDTSTAMGRMMLTVIGAMAELESEIKSDRVLARFERKRAEGEWLGRRPFGFRLDRPGGRLVVDDAEAVLVREAAQRFLAGTGLQTIARDWNRRGVRTPRKGDRSNGGGRNLGLWRAGTLREMLASDRHAGTTLTRRDHGRVTAKLAKQSDAAAPRGERYMLTGMVVCGACGAQMVGRPQGDRRAYICTSGSEVHPKGTTWTDKKGKKHDLSGRPKRVHLRILADTVERVVTRKASAVLVAAREGVADPSGPLLAERDRVEGELEALGSNRMPDAYNRSRARTLQRQLDDVDRRIDELPAPIVGYGLAALLEDVPEPTSLEWRAYLEQVVERVVVGPQVSKGVRAPSSEARVLVVWKEGVTEA